FSSRSTSRWFARRRAGSPARYGNEIVTWPRWFGIETNARSTLFLSPWPRAKFAPQRLARRRSASRRCEDGRAPGARYALRVECSRMPSTSVCYVYGIVPSAIDLASAPPGVDDARVGLERCDGVAALTSAVDGDEYAPAALEQSTADVEWMSPRAVAHD